MTTIQTTDRERVGLLAGGGLFPIHFAKAAQAQGYSVHCVGVLGMVSDELADLCDGFVAAPLGRVGKAIRLFNRWGVRRAVMAGKFHKTALFDRFRWIRHFPDLRAFGMLMRYARKDKTDDTLLLAVIREFARDDIIFESALNFCPELLVKHGFLTRRKPTSAQWRDIKFGWKLAKEMGRLDIGQTVIVKDTAVIAIEAIEGTDAAIERAGLLCKRGGMTIVKVAKPQQDMRFDVPTFGIQTLQTMHESGARVLAVEADMTILLNEDEVIRLAEKLRIAIVALNADELQLRVAS